MKPLNTSLPNEKQGKHEKENLFPVVFSAGVWVSIYLIYFENILFRRESRIKVKEVERK